MPRKKPDPTTTVAAITPIELVNVTGTAAEGPITMPDNTGAAAPFVSAAITVDQQGDFPAELGEVWGAADKPDGSRVVVTSNGQKFRRAAGSAEWVRAI